MSQSRDERDESSREPPQGNASGSGRQGEHDGPDELPTSPDDGTTATPSRAEAAAADDSIELRVAALNNQTQRAVAKIGRRTTIVTSIVAALAALAGAVVGAVFGYEACEKTLEDARNRAAKAERDRAIGAARVMAAGFEDARTRLCDVGLQGYFLNLPVNLTSGVSVADQGVLAHTVGKHNWPKVAAAERTLRVWELAYRDFRSAAIDSNQWGLSAVIDTVTTGRKALNHLAGYSAQSACDKSRWCHWKSRRVVPPRQGQEAGGPRRTTGPPCRVSNRRADNRDVGSGEKPPVDSRAPPEG